MSHEMNKTVALIDLDVQFGTIALSLDLEPSHGLREAFENPDRIDGLFIASAMVHESEHLFVLSAEEPLEDEVHINPNAFELVLASLPNDFDYILVDLPQKLAIAQRRLLSIADHVILVSDLSLAGMRDTVRLAQLVREAAPQATLNVVVNRVGSVKKGELPKQEFQRSTELPVKQFLPHDPTVAVAAANAGKPFPLIAKNSQIVKEFRKLTESVCGGPAQPKRKAGGGLNLGKLFKKK
jgi:pilus assembly protein CpaE